VKGFIISAFVFVVVGAGCKQAEHAARDETRATQPAAALPEGLILTEAPQGPLSVLAAKKSLQTGDDVVVRGLIGGRVEPFVAGRAIFQLVDSSIPTCAARGGDDHCRTPWDYCCEPKEEVTAKSVTVQVVGKDGKPLEIQLKGAGGLNPMARIIVRGKVDQKPDANTMIIRAEGIYVERS